MLIFQRITFILKFIDPLNIGTLAGKYAFTQLKVNIDIQLLVTSDYLQISKSLEKYFTPEY